MQQLIFIHKEIINNKNFGKSNSASILKFTIFELLWIWIVVNTSEINSSFQNKDFDVLQGLLNLRNSIFHILTKPALDNSSAAILDNRAVIAEIPPSALLMPKRSKSQNKCQNEGH